MTKLDVDNIIFYSDKLDIRAGGPSGYIANLTSRLKADNIKVISSDGFNFSFLDITKNFIKLIPIKKIRKILRFRINFNLKHRRKLPLYLYFKLHKYKFKTIICHNVWDVPMVKDYIIKHNPEAKLMLMSHCPQSPSSEYYDSLNDEYKSPILLNNIEKMEKDAFYMSDILVFPSEEAREPYVSSLNYFSDLIKKKKFYYIPTGASPIEIKTDKKALLKQYGINTKYVISYLGRHNEIKGYDLLKEIASNILNKRDDITFLIAGNLSDTIPSLKHPRWIELGRTHPSNVLSIADLFILPNRQTYFDLVLLEVLSTGTPIIASNTGGNKSVFKQTGAIQLYDTIDDCIEYIEEFFQFSPEQRKDLSSNCINAYINNYTPELFSQNYVSMISRILKDLKDEY